MVIMYLWLDTGGDNPDYEKDDGNFSIELHHAGWLKSEPKLEYKDGKINFFDYCNVDLMSLLEFETMLETLRYTSVKQDIYYNDGSGDLFKVENDRILQGILGKSNKRMFTFIVDHFYSPQPNLEHVPTVSPTPVPQTNTDSIPEIQKAQERNVIDVDLLEAFEALPPYEQAGSSKFKVQSDSIGDVLSIEDFDWLEFNKGLQDVRVEVEEDSDCDSIPDVQVPAYDDDDSENSTDLEYLEEEDYDVEEDSRLFEANVDKNTEWAGLNSEWKEMIDVEDTNCGEGQHVNEDSDDLFYQVGDNGSSSDDDAFGQKKKKAKKVMKAIYPTVSNDGKVPANPKFEMEMVFADSTQMAQAVKNHGIYNSRPVRIIKKDMIRCRAICQPPCKWLLFASKMQYEPTLLVKSYHPVHTCPRTPYNRNADYKWLGHHYKDRIKSNPKIPVTALMEQIKCELKLTVSWDKAWRCKRFSFHLIFGTIAAQYARIYDYGAELNRSNPGSTVKIKAEDGKFKRMYICLGSAKTGFLEYCRPLIGLDGCHLKGPAKGILLTAVGLDSNNGLWPLAYAVVESENKASWMWFIQYLKEDIGFTNGHHWCFITDKQKGLMPALDELCPNSDHRCCVRHLYNNFKTLFVGLHLKNALYDCARASTVEEFNEKMASVKELSENAFTWLAGKPPQQWSKSYFQCHVKSDMLLNNLCETFNSMILSARAEPIITMLERIRLILMKRVYLNKVKMLKEDSLLCPKIVTILDKIKEQASFCNATWSGSPKLEVDGPDGKFVCDLDAGICSCRKWELTGIPCKHAVSAMGFFALEPETFVDTCYHRDTYLKLYNNCVYPTNGPTLWPKTGLLPLKPPYYQPMTGRAPSGARRLEPGEKQNKTPANPFKLSKKNQVSLTCSNCKQSGHNKRRCNIPPKEKDTSKPKSKGGRPKKVVAESKVSAVDGPQAPKRKRAAKGSKLKYRVMKANTNQVSEVSEASKNAKSSQTQWNLCTGSSQLASTNVPHHSQSNAFTSIVRNGSHVYFKNGEKQINKEIQGQTSKSSAGGSGANK